MTTSFYWECNSHMKYKSLDNDIIIVTITEDYRNMPKIFCNKRRPSKFFSKYCHICFATHIKIALRFLHIINHKFPVILCHHSSITFWTNFKNLKVMFSLLPNYNLKMLQKHLFLRLHAVNASNTWHVLSLAENKIIWINIQIWIKEN